uniref:Uncharacterized protein n=1 Tax=Monopterus albus TaxID=43700 RepID=A0A3Q3K1A5_MONAL
MANHPQADVGDREGLVIAHVLTSRLLCVAHIVRLLIAPNKLCRCAKDEDTKDEEHCEPHPANHFTHDRSVALWNEGWGREGHGGDGQGGWGR